MATLFLYGDFGPGGDVAAWTAGLAPQLAYARGAVWTDARRHAVLVTGDAKGSVPGVVVDVDDARRQVLSVLLGGGPPEPGLVVPAWRPVAVATGLRPVQALAWSLPDSRAARLLGLRPPRGTEAR